MDKNADFDALQRVGHYPVVHGLARLRRRVAAGCGRLHASPDKPRGWRERWLDGLGLPRDSGFAAGADPLRWSDDASSSQQPVIAFTQRQSVDDDDEPYSA